MSIESMKVEGPLHVVCQCDKCKAEKQEQGEPVGVAHLMQEGYTHCIWSEACVPVGTKFYTTPQQRTWVGLMEDEIAECFKVTPDQYLTWHIYKRIEAKLKEKNNG